MLFLDNHTRPAYSHASIYHGNKCSYMIMIFDAQMYVSPIFAGFSVLSLYNL